MEIGQEDIDGSIHTLRVRNFFCHDNLEIKFNPNVNIIVGLNGSGKSAILTALVVGLGGRASATNRGSALSSFIKQGTNSATIEIKIKNNTAKAYCHNIYGDYITIVRNITRTGTSYQIKSNEGEVKSIRYEEVNAIVLAHNIQVDNPISVLNQEEARSFYATDAKKKYKFFSRATNLDQTENNYKTSIEECEKSSAKLQKKNDVLPELEREFIKWKTCYDQLQSRKEIEQERKHLQNEYYWSEIAESEQDVAKIQAWLVKQNKCVDRLKEECIQNESSFNNDNAHILALNEKLKETLKEKREWDEKLRLLEQEANEGRKFLSNLNNNIDRNRDSLNKENQKIEDLTQAIQNIQSGSAEAQHAEMEARAASAIEAAKEALACYNTAQHEAEQTRLACARAVTKEEGAVRNKRLHQQTLENLKRQFRELKSNDSLAVYGSLMTKLCDEINSKPEGYFTARPKGPIGAYLKVKEKRWGGALEHIIGGNIRSFCVNTPEDAHKLIEIMKTVYGNLSKPSVTCSRFLGYAYDVSRTEVEKRDYISALDALDISDPDIKNFLIDHIGMENILLVPDQGTAMALSSRQKDVPRRCSKIVTLDSTEFEPAPNYRSFGGSNQQIKYLHVSIAERRTQLVEEIKEQERELQALEAEAKVLNHETRQARQQESAAAKLLQTRLIQLNDKNEQERNATAALEQRQAPQFDALLDDLNTSKKKRESLELQKKELLDKREQYNRMINELDVKMNEVDTEVRALSNQSIEIRNNIDEIDTRQQQSLIDKKMTENKLREKETKIGEVVTKLAEKQAVVAGMINSALKVCPRVENPRPFADVENDLNKVSTKLNSMQSEGMTASEVKEKYLEVARRYENVKSKMAKLRNLINQTKATAEKHLKYCLQVQTEIIRRVQHTYQAMMNVRDYSGVLEIMSGAQLVKMSGGRNGTYTSSLSGGERTYATVSFILALWECVELPFYFMDEFDVWMDPVASQVALNLLIDHALKNPNRQYVFLTPKDTPSATAGPQISLHLLEDPRPSGNRAI